LIHKTYLDVDEQRAEVAAATAAPLVFGPPDREELVVFRADHPFLVLLRHNPSGTMMFLGRVMNPAVQ
jgi:serpin B